MRVELLGIIKDLEEINFYKEQEAKVILKKVSSKLTAMQDKLDGGSGEVTESKDLGQEIANYLFELIHSDDKSPEMVRAISELYHILINP